MSLLNNIAAQAEKLDERFEALSQREKILIAFASLFITIYVMFLLLIDPQIKTLTEINRKQRTQSNQLTVYNTQISEINAALNVDPNEKIKIEIQELQSQLDGIERQLASFMSDYIAPNEMSRELTSLLTGKSDIRVVGMSVNPPIRIDRNVDDKLPKYYQHLLDLIVVGDYFALMDFVKKVSEINQQFGIQAFKYEVKDHPNAHLTLSLMIISDSKNVIRL